MEITTQKSKQKIVLKDWISLGEWEEIQKPIMSVKIKLGSQGVGGGEIDVGEAYQKSTDKAIEIVIQEIDGKKEDILARVKAMERKDGEFVLKAVDGVVRGQDFTKG